LANALQHAPAGTRVLVEIARREDDQVSLSFVDSGAVVPPELRAEALSRDGQARLKGRPEGRYGRGLALYAANVGARRAGGRLDLGEREGRSVMAVILPRFDDAV
jgi:signal transduction histidine kinase